MLTAPLTPGAYLKARRCAAGLSIEDVAARLRTDPRSAEHDRVDRLKLIEADAQPASFSTIVALRAVFPFSIEVITALEQVLQGASPAIVPPLCRICAAVLVRMNDQRLCLACAAPATAETAAA